METVRKLTIFYKIDKIINLSMKSLGIVGSLLMFTVYYRAGLRKLSVSVYFRYIALLAIGHILFEYFVISNWTNLAFKSNASMKILKYLECLFSPILAWLEVAASLDRYLAIFFQFKFKFREKMVFQHLLVASLVLFNVACFLFVPIYVKIIPPFSSKHDYEINEKIENAISIIELVNGSAIPFVIMLVLSTWTFVGVLRAHRRMKNSLSSNRNRIFMRDLRFGVTMLVLNVFFLVSIVFHRMKVFFALNPFDKDWQFFSYYVFASIQSYFFNYYFSIYFFIQLAVNNVVRKKLWKLIKKVFLILFFRK